MARSCEFVIHFVRYDTATVSPNQIIILLFLTTCFALQQPNKVFKKIHTFSDSLSDTFSFIFSPEDSDSKLLLESTH